LVGRDAARAGVRLGDVALLLQHGHVVADRGRRHVQVVPVHQGPGADRLHRGDIVLDDGAQDRKLSVVEHVPPPSTQSSRVPSLWRSLRQHTGTAAMRAETALKTVARPRLTGVRGSGTFPGGARDHAPDPAVTRGRGAGFAVTVIAPETPAWRPKLGLGRC